jgi:hypothetical protein
MAYPYIPSGGLILTAFQQFRRSFPAKVDADTLKKLGIASGNEAAIINILKHLALLDGENQRTPKGAELFNLHDDRKFGEVLGAAVRDSYEPLFDLHGDSAWTLDRDALISFFRSSDQTSAVTGARQALTFQTLAAIAEQRADQIASRKSYSRRSANPSKAAREPKAGKSAAAGGPMDELRTGSSSSGKEPVGLTVRIEINLPANGSQETYDNIFQSIRKNLLNGRA